MVELKLDEMTAVGTNTRRGNLLSIQPYMLPADYTSADTLCAKLEGYLDAARQAGWINPLTIAVFPEYIGTWLVVSGEDAAVYAAENIASGIRRMVMRHLFPFIKAFLTAKEKDRLTASVFRMQAARMASDYQAVFSELAKRFVLTIVAGSILLPAPQVKEGEVVAGVGPLYNVTAVFKPDGKAHPKLSFKAFPIESELSFITPASQDGLPVFETPAGKLGVLVCADGWYPQLYERLKAQGVDFVVVPSFATGNGQWDIPWGGYNGALAPADVNYKDVGYLTEGQAWRKYALAGRLSQAGARAGANVFLHGSLWDLGSDSGRSLIVNGAGFTETRSKEGAILNLWL